MFYLECFVENNIIPAVDLNIQAGDLFDCRTNHRQVFSPVIFRPTCEEGTVEVAQIVVHGAASANEETCIKTHSSFKRPFDNLPISSGKMNGGISKVREIDLGPGILMPAYNHTGLVSPQ